MADYRRVYKNIDDSVIKIKSGDLHSFSLPHSRGETEEAHVVINLPLQEVATNQYGNYMQTIGAVLF